LMLWSLFAIVIGGLILGQAITQIKSSRARSVSSRRSKLLELH
jgi:hypothetical protein